MLGCSWLFVHPYLTGKVNYMVTDLQTHGMRGRGVFPGGWVLVSIPFNWIPTIVQSLKEMKWDVPEYSLGRDHFVKEMDRMIKEIKREMGRE